MDSLCGLARNIHDTYILIPFSCHTLIVFLFWLCQILLARPIAALRLRLRNAFRDAHWIQQRRALESAMDEAQSYREWKKAASSLDRLEGINTNMRTAIT